MSNLLREVKMPIENELKAPQGKFAVCVWDMYPRMEPPAPSIVDVFSRQSDAEQCAWQKNSEWFGSKKTGLSGIELAAYLMDGRGRLLEPEYFVVDENGEKVY